MQAKTHITAGAAAALAITHPATVPALICAVAGGGVGGWISDIDVRKNPDAKGVLESLPSVLFVVVISLALDYFFGLGIVESVTSNAGVGTVVGAVMFAALFVAGAASPHRTITHSLLCCALWGLSVCLVHPQLGAAFSIGLATHLALDLFNKRGEQLLFPLKRRFCLGRCPSNGRADQVLGAVGLTATVVLAGWFGVGALAGSSNIPAMLGAASSSAGVGGMDLLGTYLVTVNALTVLVCVLLVVVSSLLPAAETFFTYLILVLSGLGGAFAVIAALLFTSALFRVGGETLQHRGDEGDSLLYVVAVALALMWGVMLFLLGTGRLGTVAVVDPSPLAHVPPIAYLALINVVTFVLLFRDDKQRRSSSLHPRELRVLALALIGGSMGAIIALAAKSSGVGANQTHFKYGLPVALAANAIIVALLVVNGAA